MFLYVILGCYDVDKCNVIHNNFHCGLWAEQPVNLFSGVSMSSSSPVANSVIAEKPIDSSWLNLKETKYSFSAS